MYKNLFILCVLGSASCFTTPTAMVVPMKLREGSHSGACMSLSNTAATATAVIGAASIILSAGPVFAADPTAGEIIFNANCAGCHAGGHNVIVADHDLTRAAIEKFMTGGFNEAAVMYQVTNGKNAMPAFGGRLSKIDIENVASFVINTAENDAWESE
jgi:cytochrome c6